jgi:hypothetical protein
MSKVNQFSSGLAALFACTILTFACAAPRQEEVAPDRADSSSGGSPRPPDGEATPPPKGPVIEPVVEPVMDAIVPVVADAAAPPDVVPSRPDATPPPIEAAPPADAGIADGASPPDVTTAVDAKVDVALPGPAAEVVRLATSADASQADFDKYVGAGHRLVWQDGFDAGQGLAFNAIYRLEPNAPAWRARSGLTGAQLQAEINLLAPMGYRPIQIDSYPVDDVVRYALISEKTKGAEFFVYFGRNAADNQKLFDQRVANGWVPVNMTVTALAGNASYAGIYERRDVQHISYSALTRAGFDDMQKAQVAAGYSLVYAKAYSLSGSLRISAIWWQQGSASTVVRADLSQTQFETEVGQNRAKGLSTRLVTGYPMMGESRFLGIWSQ